MLLDLVMPPSMDARSKVLTLIPHFSEARLSMVLTGHAEHENWRSVPSDVGAWDFLG